MGWSKSLNKASRPPKHVPTYVGEYYALLCRKFGHKKFSWGQAIGEIRHYAHKSVDRTSNTFGMSSAIITNLMMCGLLIKIPTKQPTVYEYQIVVKDCDNCDCRFICRTEM